MDNIIIKKVTGTKADIQQFIDTLNLQDYFSSGDKVVIKPNFVAPRENQTGATTNLDLIAVIAEKLHSLGIEPSLFEVPGMEFDRNKVYNFLGIYDFCSKNKIKLLLPERNDYEYFYSKERTLMKGFLLPSFLRDYKILNLPVMKTHVITKVTLGMKNLMGFCHNDTRKIMHILGIHQTVYELNQVIKPTLTIIDGIYSMEGDGAVYGNVVKSGILIAGKDVLLTDVTACRIMGIDPGTIDYLKRALKDRIEPITKIDPVKFYKLPKQGMIYQGFYRMLYLIDLVWEPLFRIHFNEWLYRTGIAGTHPLLRKVEICAECGLCITHCPEKAISDELKINRKKCIRCLRCYAICPIGRISVKGLSNPGH